MKNKYRTFNNQNNKTYRYFVSYTFVDTNGSWKFDNIELKLNYKLNCYDNIKEAEELIKNSDNKKQSIKILNFQKL